MRLGEGDEGEGSGVLREGRVVLGEEVEGPKVGGGGLDCVCEEGRGSALLAHRLRLAFNTCPEGEQIAYHQFPQRQSCPFPPIPS